MNKNSPLMIRRIIWAAMVQGVVLFCGILIYLSSQSHKHASTNYEMIKYVFLLISLTSLLSLGKIKSYILKDSAASLPPFKPDPAKVNTGFIIVMAICEGSILLGAILAYISGNMTDLYILVIPGGIGMLLNFPREE